MTSDPTATSLLPSVEGLRPAAVVAGEPRPGLAHVLPNPATAQTYDHVGWASPGDVRDAVDAARHARAAWADATPRRRAAVLRSIAHDVRAHAEDLALVIMRETGKRAAEALAEATFSSEYFDWFADAATAPADSHLQKRDQRYIVTSRPVGVVAAVTPWNFPLSIPARKVGAALAAGCPVVLKASELAPLSALAMLTLIDAHAPRGLVNVVIGDGAELTSALVDHEDVMAVSFTGSTRVGVLVAERAMRTMTRATMELGGMAPFIVEADADLGLAVGALLLAKFRNNGASCIAANNVYVHAAVYDDVMSSLAEQITSLEVGPPEIRSTDVGPLSRPAHVDRLRRLVAEAESEGCQTWEAPVPETGWFFPPTLVAASASSRLWREEIFGPVCAVRPFGDIDEVVHEVNGCRAGLAGYIMSSAPERCLVTASRLNVGIVGINNGAPNTPEVPFGGFGLAGLGREGGIEGVREFMEPQTIALAR